MATHAASTVLRRLREQHPIPALSAAVCRSGELIWQEAQGLADVELGVAAKPSHLFRIGSVSKLLTAAAAARLAENGLVDLDAPIADYLPGLPPAHRATTLRQLFCHQGGVRHYLPGDFDPTAPGGFIDLRTYRDTADALALFIDDPLIAAPGTAVHYSTFGYTLVSAVLEAASARSFLTLVEFEVLLPLGLRETAPDEPLAPLPGRVRNYDPGAFYARMLKLPVPDAPVVNAIPSNPAYKWAGGGFVASARDVARFGGAHLGDGYLSAGTRAMVFAPVTSASETMPPLGLGWRIDSHPDLGLRYHHAGNMQGCRAQLALYPDRQLSVALLGNLGMTPGDILRHTDSIAESFA